MIHSKTARCAAALVIGVAAVSLAGCGSSESLSQSIQQKLNRHVETVDYATGAIGKGNQNARLPTAAGFTHPPPAALDCTESTLCELLTTDG
jgi:hypothetical protein